jgi:hypothetical protein
VDAYFYPPVMYYETYVALGELDTPIPRFAGDCPTEATVEYDWAHARLGSVAAG